MHLCLPFLDFYTLNALLVEAVLADADVAVQGQRGPQGTQSVLERIQVQHYLYTSQKHTNSHHQYPTSHVFLPVAGTARRHRYSP